MRRVIPIRGITIFEFIELGLVVILLFIPISIRVAFIVGPKLRHLNKKIMDSGVNPEK